VSKCNQGNLNSLKLPSLYVLEHKRCEHHPIKTFLLL